MLSTTEPVAQVTGQSSAMNSSSHLEAKSTPSSSAQPAQRGSAEPKGRPGTVASCAWMSYPLRVRTVMLPTTKALACIALCALISCRSTTTIAADDLDAAIAATRASKQFVLVDWGASWCGPCRRMEETSWSNPRVRSWIDAHAVFARLDRDRLEARANAALIRALPTVIAYRDGVEFDRISGYRDADDLLAWLEALARGETNLALLSDRAGVSLNDSNTRHRLARELARIGKLDEAARAYVELWPKRGDADDPLAVRLPDEMRSLALQNEPARAAFEALRAPLVAHLFGTARAAAAVDAAHEQDWDAWLTLAYVLDDRHALVAWFEDAFDSSFAPLTNPRPRAALVLAHRDALWRALASEGRYARLVQLVEVSTPVVVFAENRAQITDFERASFDETTLTSMRRERTREVALLRAGCLALARTRDADAIERALLAHDESDEARAALVEAVGATHH